MSGKKATADPYGMTTKKARAIATAKAEADQASIGITC
jgi:hypothetical protein